MKFQISAIDIKRTEEDECLPILQRCKNAFCSACIKRNLGRKAVSTIEEDDDWRCLACEPDQVRAPRALFYSIYQYWVRERAKAEKRQERLNKRKGVRPSPLSKKSVSREEDSDDEDGGDDPVKGLLNDAEKASDILKDYISNEQRKWRRRRAAIRADGSSQTMEDAVLHVTQNLKKIIDVTNHNLKEVARIADKVVAEEIEEEVGEAVDEPAADVTSDKEVENSEDVTPANDDIENGDVEMAENGPPIRTSTANGNKTGGHGKAVKADVDVSPIKIKIKLPRSNDGETAKTAKTASLVSGDETLDDTVKAPPSDEEEAGPNEDNGASAKNKTESEDAEAEAKAKVLATSSSDEELKSAEKAAKAKVLATSSSSDPDVKPEKTTKAKEEAEAKARVLATSSSDAESAAPATPATPATPAKSAKSVVNGDINKNVGRPSPLSKKTNKNRNESAAAADEEKAKAKVLATSSSEEPAAAEPMEVDGAKASPEDHKKKKKQMKTRKELDKLRGAAKDGAASSEDEGGDDDADDGGGSGGNAKKAKKDAKAEKTAQDGDEDASKPKVSHEERLKRRFRKLIAAIDLRNDEKLNTAKAEVKVERLSEKVTEDLKKFGEVRVEEFPELAKLLKGRKGGNKKSGGRGVSYDTEIDRLCDLAGLEKGAASNYSPSKASRDRSTAKKLEKSAALKLAGISSGDDDNGDNGDNVSGEDAVNGAGKKTSNANDLARARVLASSSSGEDVEMDSDGGGGEKTKKGSDGAKEKSGAKGRSNGGGAREPNFLRTKLSETDSDDAQDRARKKREKKDSEDKKRKGEGGDNSNADGGDSGSGSSAFENSPLKKKSGKRGRKKIVSDSDELASSEEEEDKDDDDDESFNDSDDSEIQVMKKAKARKRKKKSSSDDDDPDSDDVDKPKKKRKRIKKNSSSEDNDENDEDKSPKKRKDIRKILSDKKVSSDTKEAALEERERRKRIEDRQKEYNEMFKVKEGESRSELPLDYVKETKEVLVEVDKRIVKKLKPHQEGGIKFMWDTVFESKEKTEKGEVAGGAILAHCMGLGKTLQTIGLVHTVHTNFEEHVGKILVLCPVNVVKNWVDEFAKWLKGDLELEVHEMSDEKDNWGRADRLNAWMTEGGIMILGYDMFRNLTNESKKYKKKQRDIFQGSSAHCDITSVKYSQECDLN